MNTAVAGWVNDQAVITQDYHRPHNSAALPFLRLHGHVEMSTTFMTSIALSLQTRLISPMMDLRYPETKEATIALALFLQRWI